MSQKVKLNFSFGLSSVVILSGMEV